MNSLRDLTVATVAQIAKETGRDIKTVFPSYNHGEGTEWYHGKPGSRYVPCWTVAWVEAGKCTYLHPDLREAGYTKADFE